MALSSSCPLIGVAYPFSSVAIGSRCGYKGRLEFSINDKPCFYLNLHILNVVHSRQLPDIFLIQPMGGGGVYLKQTTLKRLMKSS